MQSLFLWNGYLLRVRYRNRLPFVVGKDGSKQLCCFMPKNWACSLNFSCHISHFWLIWLILLREVFSCVRVFMRVRIWNRLCFIVEVDASKLVVLWEMLLCKVFSYGRVFIRVRIRDWLCFVVTVVRFLVNADTKIFIRIKNENTTDFSSSIGNRNCRSSFYYWEIWDLRLKF